MKPPASCRPPFLALLCLPLVALPRLARADTPAVVPATIPAASLPLRDVVLFSSGVGYFGRQGRIDGACQIDLSFRATQISDILKSLVLSDPQSGLGPVTYSLADYLGARPVGPGIKLPAAASMGEVLRCFQGAKIRLDEVNAVVEGTILSVAARNVKQGTEWENLEFLTLLTEDGVTTELLNGSTTVKLADPALDAALRDSLLRQAAAFTAKVDDGVRNVSVHFTGAGARNVGAGYLEETPAWKTSYRLVVAADGTATLQGWAIVENTTDSDWQNVNLNLVSGQPVSFIQDLSTPVYVTRPVVASSVIGSATPQTYGGGYDMVNGLPAAANKPVAALAGMAGLAGYGGGGAGEALDSARRNMALADDGALKYRIGAGEARPAPTMIMNTPQANGAKRGELFAYSISDPVTLQAGKAAMVPIVGAPVEGKPVTIAISNGSSVGELSPANGFRLMNSTHQHLQGGPITVYAGGIYAGDALTTDIAPDETRLISYAADLDTSVRLDNVEQKAEITKLSALAGILSTTTSYTRTRTFLLKNKSAAAKSVLLQLPPGGTWKLADPTQLLEKSADGDRFGLEVPAGKTVTYSIVDSLSQTSTRTIFDMTYDVIIGYSRERSISAELKSRLLELQARRDALAALNTERDNQEKKLAAIVEDQSRIRQNMHELNNTSALYKSYETKLAAQEPQVETLHDSIAGLRDQAAQKTKDLAAYAASISGQ